MSNSVPARAVTFYSEFEYSFESGGKSSYSNVMICSESKCTVNKCNRLFEVVCLVIQQRALQISWTYCTAC